MIGLRSRGYPIRHRARYRRRRSISTALEAAISLMSAPAAERTITAGQSRQPIDFVAIQAHQGARPNSVCKGAVQGIPIARGRLSRTAHFPFQMFRPEYSRTPFLTSREI